MKSRFYPFLALSLLTLLVSTVAFTAPGVNLTAAAAVLMDYTTGEILFQKNANQRRAPASTTKIMTAILAIERGTPTKIITASARASKADGSSIWLAPGERHTLKDLLYGILLSSGNDASIAVAEDLAGSESKFAALMNAKAREIGAENTHFVNCNGLPEKEHYSTAYDLALIARYALRYPLFEEIVRTRKKIIAWPGHKWDRIMYNHNKLLWRYKHADGIKTGYTLQAGKCLVSSATKDGHRLIAVVLKSRDTYGDSERLFNYGFDHFQLLTVATPEKKLGAVNVDEGIKEQVPVATTQPVQLLIPKGAEDKLKINMELPESVKAPVKQDQPVGELAVQLGNKVLERAALVTAAPVPRKSLWQRIWDWFKELLN